MLPVDASGLPTGAPVTVDGTRFDYREGRVIGQALESASLTWRDVVASRIYMLDTTLWADAARAFPGRNRPHRVPFEF